MRGTSLARSCGGEWSGSGGCGGSRRAEVAAAFCSYRKRHVATFGGSVGKGNAGPAADDGDLAAASI